MSISIEDVEKVARLARLAIDADRREPLAAELNAILGYFAKLQEVDTEGVEPSTHAVDLSNALRDDDVRESLPVDTALAGAPAADQGCFIVPRIIEV